MKIILIIIILIGTYLIFGYEVYNWYNSDKAIGEDGPKGEIIDSIKVNKIFENLHKEEK